MFELEKLNYEYNELEPVIDAKTVELHYTKHHQGYLNNTNVFLEKYHYEEGKTLEEIVQDVSFLKEEDKVGFLFNAGGVLNHNLYWKILSNKRNNTPVDKVKTLIDENYGSFETFKEEFIAKANKFTGSGWIFLVITKDNKLDIVLTDKQNSPVFEGLKPIIGLDLWEHAYYLNYQNRRPDYINGFFEVLDFEEVNKLI